MTQPNVPERQTILADKLKPGDWVAELVDGDPWSPKRRDAEILSVHPYTDEVKNARVLLVAQVAGESGPDTERPLADTPVRLLTDAERSAMRVQAERAQKVADIRSFADFLEQHPALPVTNIRMQASLNPHGDVWNTGAEGVAEVRRLAGLFDSRVMQDNEHITATREAGTTEYVIVAWHKDGRPAEPEAVAVDPDPTGLTYSRVDDDPQVIRPHSPRLPLHTGAVVDGGELVDETPAEVHTAEVYFSEAYREAFRLARQADPGHRSSPELRHAAALDLLHGQALTEDAERTRRADVREGEQGRITNLGVAHFLAVKEERSRIARHFLGLEESAKHYPAEPVSEAR